jgi:hypothetical protein
VFDCSVQSKIQSVEQSLSRRPITHRELTVSSAFQKVASEKER